MIMFLPYLSSQAIISCLRIPKLWADSAVGFKLDT